MEVDLEAQLRHNPEMRVVTRKSNSIMALIDKLMHVRKVRITGKGEMRDVNLVIVNIELSYQSVTACLAHHDLLKCNLLLIRLHECRN